MAADTNKNSDGAPSGAMHNSEGPSGSKGRPSSGRASGSDLNAEIARLVEATVAGRLSERAEVERFDGEDRKLLEGINTLIDAFVAPINVTAEYVDR
ncbi:MAG: hypothetical protein ACE5F9_14570, partial [Phycisphaerae bacterium]